jgi:hypothetical protein
MDVITSTIDFDVASKLHEIAIPPELAEPVVAEFQSRAGFIREKLQNIAAAFVLGTVPLSGVTGEAPQVVESEVTVSSVEAEAQTTPQNMETISVEKPDSTLNVSVEKPSVAEMYAGDPEQLRISERLKQDFKDEDELLAFCQTIAERSSVEHFVIYGKNDKGEVKVLESGSGTHHNVYIPHDKLEADEYRKEGYTDVTILHTHPRDTIDSLTPSGEVTSETATPRTFPFSTPDLVGFARKAAYDSRFADDRRWKASRQENVVVDPSGVWRYRVDIDSPFLQQLVQERTEGLLNSEEAKEYLARNPEVTTETLKDIISAISSPDSLVRARGLESVTKSNSDSIDVLIQMISLYSNGSYGPETSVEKEFAANQIAVSEGKMTIDEFIDYCKQKGITVSYSTFSKNKQNTEQ